MKSFVRDNVLEIRGFSRVSANGLSSAWIAAFSISEVVFRDLKLSLGRRLLKVALLLDDDVPRESLTLAKLGLKVGEKLTLLGVVGVKGMFILTKSSPASSRVRDCVSKLTSCRLQCWLGDVSSTISGEFPTYKTQKAETN